MYLFIYFILFFYLLICDACYLYLKPKAYDLRSAQDTL